MKILLVAPLVLAIRGSDISPKILNGERIYVKPWMVYLSDTATACGGTHYTKQTVITAAHCIGKNIGDWYAHLNRSDLNKTQEEEGGSSHQVLDKVNHPNYRTDNIYTNYDVAVCYIDNDNDFISLVELDDGAEVKNKEQPVFSIGWGKTRKVKPGEENLESAGKPSQVLMYARSSIIDDKVCKARYTDQFSPYTMICTGEKDSGAVTCQGDSGGPVYRYRREKIVMIGIISASVGCGYMDYYDLSTKISEPTIIKFINCQAEDFKLKSLMRSIQAKKN